LKGMKNSAYKGRPQTPVLTARFKLFSPGRRPYILWFMSDHEDRSPLVAKLSLRQALIRVRQETENFSHFEALAHNLGWEGLEQAAASAREALAAAEARIAEAVAAAEELQSTKHEHPHHHHEHN
jgi:hypothetical protein